MTALPVLFVSHGAPTFVLEPGRAGATLTALGRSLPKPAAILVVSAHWETDRPTVSGATQPDTIHDFYGFPPALYQMRYPAPGAPALATRVQAALAAAGIEAEIDPQRGLDHGAWVPLTLIWPDADIPVTQLSVQPDAGAAHHYAVGQALAALAEAGVMIVASGSVTHNLREFRMQPEDAGVEPYGTEFRDWLRARIEAHDDAAVIAYREQAPHAVRAHPTEEHFLPLHVALGAAADGATHRRIHDGVTFGVIGMDAYLLAAERLPAVAG